VTDIAARPFLEGLTFGEGPRWHGGRLWYSDFFHHAVFSVSTVGTCQPSAEAEVPGRPSGLGWLPDSRLLVVSMEDRRVLRREHDGTMATHAHLSAWAPCEANDMLVDGQGRAYVGQFGFDLDAYFHGRGSPTQTSLLRVDPDGTVSEAAATLSFPNGLVRLGTKLVVAETFGMRLTAFDVAPNGSLSNRRVWAALDGCAPDGICGDAGGAIWVANARASECLRVAEGGTVLDRVLTSQPCFACALGGADRRTLFCCTAPTSHAERIRDRTDGRIEVASVPVPGAGLP
jgi:sugar lactone lactonase YvrE